MGQTERRTRWPAVGASSTGADVPWRDVPVTVPDRPAGGRATAAAALVLLLPALAGELRAPAAVLPAPVTLALVAGAAIGLVVLVATTGLRDLVTGREVRLGALVPIGVASFLVAGPRFRLLVIMLWCVACALAAGVAIAAAVNPTDRRDRIVAVLALGVACVGGWHAEGVVREARLAVHADRYRSEAEALIGHPIDGADVRPIHDLDVPIPAYRTFGSVPSPGEQREPHAVAWLWDPGEDGPASSSGVVYAPEDDPVQAHVLWEGQAIDCTAAVVDDFYWCTFH